MDWGTTSLFSLMPLGISFKLWLLISPLPSQEAGISVHLSPFQAHLLEDPPAHEENRWVLAYSSRRSCNLAEEIFISILQIASKRMSLREREFVNKAPSYATG